MADQKNTPAVQPKAEAEAKAAAADFDKKWLKGLKFSTTKVEKIDGKEKRVPVVRLLTEAEVLSWRIDGKQVVIVAADGKKHRVEK